jgi:hypothetical protein
MENWGQTACESVAIRPRRPAHWRSSEDTHDVIASAGASDRPFRRQGYQAKLRQTQSKRAVLSATRSWLRIRLT